MLYVLASDIALILCYLLNSNKQKIKQSLTYTAYLSYAKKESLCYINGCGGRNCTYDL